MKLNEKFYTRTIYGLTECDGKRINKDYAVIRPWFSSDGVKYKLSTKNRYYVIHIKSGLGITKTSYTTIKGAVENFESDLKFALDKIKAAGKDFDVQIKIAIEQFDKMMESGKFYEKDGDKK